MSASSDEGWVAFDIVYAGRRMLASGKAAAAVHQVLSNGRLGEPMLYDPKTFKRWVLGGVYRGATFNGDRARGLSATRYQTTWPDEAARIDWRIRDERAEEELRTGKLIKDAKKIHEIEAVMLPLRKLYEGYHRRHDSAGKEALELAVLRALRAAPRASE